MGFRQFRMREVDLNIIEGGLYVLDLGDRVPTFIPLFPAVAIRETEVTSAQQFHTDRCILTQDDGNRVSSIARAFGIHAFDRKITFPPSQLDDAIMGRSIAHVFYLRRQRDDLSCIHRRHIGDAKSRLMTLKLPLCLTDESIQGKNARATDEEHNKECDQY